MKLYRFISITRFPDPFLCPELPEIYIQNYAKHDHNHWIWGQSTTNSARREITSRLPICNLRTITARINNRLNGFYSCTSINTLIYKVLSTTDVYSSILTSTMSSICKRSELFLYILVKITVDGLQWPRDTYVWWLLRKSVGRRIGEAYDTCLLLAQQNTALCASPSSYYLSQNKW